VIWNTVNQILLKSEKDKEYNERVQDPGCV